MSHWGLRGAKSSLQKEMGEVGTGSTQDRVPRAALGSFGRVESFPKTLLDMGWLFIDRGDCVGTA